MWPKRPSILTLSLQCPGVPSAPLQPELSSQGPQEKPSNTDRQVSVPGTVPTGAKELLWEAPRTFHTNRYSWKQKTGCRYGSSLQGPEPEQPPSTQLRSSTTGHNGPQGTMGSQAGGDPETQGTRGCCLGQGLVRG